MKNRKTFIIGCSLIAMFLFSIDVKSQDIRTFFRILPMPYEWGWGQYDEKVKDDLLKNGKLEDTYFESLGVSFGGEMLLDLDIRNGYLSISQDVQQLELCYWKYGGYRGAESLDCYLVAVCLSSGDTNGSSTDYIQFYTVYPDNKFYPLSTDYVTERIQVSDFFSDRATKKDIENSYASLIVELPRKGKTIVLRCDLGDGDGSGDRIRNAVPLMKGDIIELKFEDGRFAKGEPRKRNTYYFSLSNQ